MKYQGEWVVEVQRAGLAGQYSYCTRNPQGGSFGTNMGSGVSLTRTLAAAARNIPPGAAYRLFVCGQPRGLQEKKAEVP